LAVLTPEEEAQYEDRLLKWLEILERRLEGRDFLVGDRFTQAEISVFPRVMMYAFLQIHPSRDCFPNVTRWMDRLRKRPSFVRTLSNQDRGLLRLARTPVLPWLQRTLAKPEAARSWSETLGLSLARRIARRALAGADSAARGASAHPRAIRRPRNGAIPPADFSVARLSRPSDALRRQPIVLYDIRILLREKGLSWRTVQVDMSRMSHKAPDYLSINPNGEIPALRHGDRVLYDSQVIAEYLDRIYADDATPRLYPVDAFAAAQVRMWLALEAGTHKEFRPLFYRYFVRRDLLAEGITADQVDEIVPAGVHPSHRDWLRDTINGAPRFDTNEDLARAIIAKKLDFMDEQLRGREYLVGDQLTMADVAWYTRIDSFAVLQIPLTPDRHPNVSRWYGTVARRPSIASGD
jgi:glutathione S-transferase